MIDRISTTKRQHDGATNNHSDDDDDDDNNNNIIINNHDGASSSSISRANALFDELLGDDASALGSIDKKLEGDASTAMSSVLGPIVSRANTGFDGGGGGGKGGKVNGSAFVAPPPERNEYQYADVVRSEKLPHRQASSMAQQRHPHEGKQQQQR